MYYGLGQILVSIWKTVGFAGDFTDDQIQAIEACLGGHITLLEDDTSVSHIYKPTDTIHSECLRTAIKGKSIWLSIAT